MIGRLEGEGFGWERHRVLTEGKGSSKLRELSFWKRAFLEQHKCNLFKWIRRIQRQT